jgi:hypothetical protein
MMATHKKERIIGVPTGGKLSKIIVCYTCLRFGRRVLIHKLLTLDIRALICGFGHRLRLRNILVVLSPPTKGRPNHSYTIFHVELGALLAHHIIHGEFSFGYLLLLHRGVPIAELASA